MVRQIAILVFSISVSFVVNAQEQQSYDSLRKAIINLDSRISEVELNLETSQKKFRSGILIATLGYTTTIAGGLMLGRQNDELGQGLLMVGGATGIFGTYKMVDAFRFLTGQKRKKKK
ncbi:MAG: hypothetical protein AAF616_12070 [Bacteroidota bacterium]